MPHFDCFSQEDKDSRQSSLLSQTKPESSTQGARPSAQLKKSKLKTNETVPTKRSVSKPLVSSTRSLRSSTAMKLNPDAAAFTPTGSMEPETINSKSDCPLTPHVSPTDIDELGGFEILTNPRADINGPL